MLAALVVLGAAWPFGAVEPFWAGLASALVLVLVAAELVVGAAVSRPPGLPGRAILALVAFAVIPLVALIPVPAGVHAVLSSGSARLWAEVGGPAGMRPLSLDPLSTVRASVLAAAVAAVAFLGARASATGAGANAVRWTLLAGGAALAAFGLVQRLWDYDAETIYWSIPLQEIGTPFGPFVNRNHFAGAMELFCGVSAGLVLEALALRARARAVVAGAVLGLLLMALVATTSRGGVLGVGVATVVLLWTARGVARRRLALAAAGLSTLAFGALVALGLGGQWVRMFVTEAVKRRWENRFLVQADALEVFAGHPLAGTGAGTFELAYPPFQTVPDGRHFGDAHSDWVQFLMETGLLGMALGLLVLWVVVPPIVRAIRSGHPSRWQVAGPAAGIAAIVVHGFLEVNLHVPSNALLASLVLSLAYGAALGMRAGDTGAPSAGGTPDQEDRRWAASSSPEEPASSAPTSPSA